MCLIKNRLTNEEVYQIGKEFIPYLSIIDFLFNIKNPKDSFNKIEREGEKREQIFI